MRAQRITLFSFLSPAVAVMVGCATQKASLADLPVQEYAGHFTSGPGKSWFRPCGAAPGDRPWWVTFTERSVAQADEARAAGRLAPGNSYYVRWRAALTTGGEVGPQGPGVPALLVRELLDLRPAGADDCAGEP
jgi:hypothetical protein